MSSAERQAASARLSPAMLLAATVLAVAVWLAVNASAGIDSEAAEEVEVAEAFAGGDAARLRALLIGIADYPPSSGTFRSLRGPRNDVNAMRDVLLERFGFLPDNVTTLRDEAATLEGIVGAIDGLIDVTQPDDDVLLYFACHGSRVPDRSGREDDDLDSSIVAYDSRTGGREGSHDLSDDALYSMLRVLTEDRRAHVTVVTDVCHSGGVVRGGRSLGPRGLPEPGSAAPDVSSWGFWPERILMLDDDERPPEELRRYVHLSACAPDQEAIEYEFDGGVVHGVMTYSLLQVLEEAQPTDTFDAIGRRTAAKMQLVPGASQSLWCEGTGRDRELFGRRFHPRPDGFEVTTEGSAERVQIAAGRLHGVVRGAVLRIDDENGRTRGRVVVRQAEFGRAEGKWESAPRDLPPDAVLRGTVVERPSDLDKLEVYTPVERIVELLPAEAAQWATVQSDRPDRGEYELDLDEARHLRLRTREGIPLWTSWLALADPIDELPEIEMLVARLETEVGFVALWNLANPDLRCEFTELRVEPVEPTEAELARAREEMGLPFEVVEATAHARGLGAASGAEYEATLATYDEQERKPPAELVVLAITNESSEKLYLHVVSVAENRETNVLWPPKGVKDRATDADHRTVRVPVWIGSPDATSFPLARPMRDRYLVIAARRQLDLAPYEYDPDRVRGSHGPPQGERNLPGILRAVLDGAPTRGGRSVPDPAKGWGVAWLDLLVTRER